MYFNSQKGTTQIPSCSMTSGGNTREAKALRKMSENSCAEKRNKIKFCNAVIKDEPTYLIQTANPHFFKIPIWTYDGHMGSITVGGRGKVHMISCECHVAVM